MSFILDALKKSENDRQRQSGPALFEVRVPPPRSRFPLLAIAIVSLLVVNLGVVAWLMLRKPAPAAIPDAVPTGGEAKPANPQPPAASAAPPIPPPYAGQPAPPPQGYAAQGYGPPAGQAPPPGTYGANGYPPNSGAYQQAPNGGYPAPPPSAGAYFQRGEQGGTPNGFQQGGYSQAPNARGYGQNPHTGGFGAPSGPVLAEGGNEPVNPDDYAPAREPAAPSADTGRVTRGTESGVPSYDEVASKTQLPPLHLDLHSYAPDPAKRFVLVNMHRLYEGQTTAEGVKVESITNDAAILSYKGTRFMLESE
jgi:general secretion pathway protein B